MTLTEFLQEYNWSIAPEGHHHSRAGWLQFDCPYCGHGSRAYHMGYSLSGGYCNCWKCGYHPLQKVLISISGLGPTRIQALDLSIPKIPKPDYSNRKLVIPKGLVPLLHIHKHYLRNRRLDPNEMEKLWDLKGFGLAGNGYSWRIFIPIYYHGDIVSWTTRSVATQDNRLLENSNRSQLLRYKAARESWEKIPHKTLLYGEDYVRHSIVICEGPFDVFRIGPGAVSTCGTSYTQSQVEKISKYPRRTVCFDSDAMAQKRARMLCDQISVFPGETNCVELDYKDPGDSSLDEIRRLRRDFID